MPANFNTDEISNDNIEIVEEDGDLIQRHIPTGAEFIFDSTANAWVPAQGLDLRGSGLANAQLATDLDANNNSVSNVDTVTTDDLSATNGLVAGEEIGNDSQTGSRLSVEVDNWSDLKQIIIKVDRFRADGTDHDVQLIIDSDDSNSNYGYLNNDDSSAEDSVFRLFEASDDIIVGGTITITRIDGDESLVVNQLSGTSATSISRISTKANLGIYEDAIESGVAIDTDGAVNGSAEMTVFGVR